MLVDEAQPCLLYTSHQTYLYPQLTGLENLEFYGRMYQVAEPRRQARLMLEEMGLGAVMDLSLIHI